MDKFLIVVGVVGVVCALAALIGIGMTAASQKHWGMALSCLACFSVILFLLLAGLEYQSTFWETHK